MVVNLFSAAVPLTASPYTCSPSSRRALRRQYLTLRFVITQRTEGYWRRVRIYVPKTKSPQYDCNISNYTSKCVAGFEHYTTVAGLIDDQV